MKKFFESGTQAFQDYLNRRSVTVLDVFITLFLAMVVVTVILFLTGCQSNPPLISVERAKALPDAELCSVYGNTVRAGNAGPAEELKSEIERRQLFLATDELGTILREAVAVGDSEYVLYAAWGLPDIQNRTVTASGVRIQHVYRNYQRGPYARSEYAYTRNGRIVGVQN